MTGIAIVITLACTYALIGMACYVVGIYMEWYEGKPITVGDLVNGTLLIVAWPVIILDILREWRMQQMRRNPDHVPLGKRVVLKGRLDARVERALKE